MSTDLETLKFFYDIGEEQGATHMIVAYDGWEDYPIYVQPGQNPRDRIPAEHRVMECYRYSLGWDTQCREFRAEHWEMD